MANSIDPTVACYKDNYSDVCAFVHNDLILSVRNLGDNTLWSRVWRTALSELAMLVWGALCLAVATISFPFYVLGIVYAFFAGCGGCDQGSVGEGILGNTLFIPSNYAWEAAKFIFWNNFAQARPSNAGLPMQG